MKSIFYFKQILQYGWLNLKIFNTVKKINCYLSNGIFLLVLFISVKTIWLDESLSIDFSRQGIKDILYFAADLHPPLYNLSFTIQGGIRKRNLELSSLSAIFIF